MAVTTVSAHYSKVDFNRILQRKERNVNNLVSMTVN